MRRLFSLVAVLAGLALAATPANAQRGGVQAAQAAAQPGGWCQKCVEPGTCVDTGSGEWGYTYCRGLGNNQCAAGGNYCMWSTGADNVVRESIELAAGEYHTLTPLAPFVLTGADCSDGATLVVQSLDGTFAQIDAGATASVVMRLASR